MGLEKAVKAIVRVKDASDIYYACLPISTIREVYYNLDEGVTLEDYFNSVHVTQKIYHVDKLEDRVKLALPNSGYTVYLGDIITVGGTPSEPHYIFMVIDQDNLVEDSSYLLLAGPLDDGSAPEYRQSFKYTIEENNWEPDDMTGYVATMEDPDDIIPYKYTITNTADMRFVIADNNTSEVTIDFNDMSDLEKALEMEMHPISYEGRDDTIGSYIALRSNYPPTGDINVTINIRSILVPQQ